MDVVNSCAQCGEAISFGRRRAGSKQRFYCGLCEAKTACAVLEQDRQPTVPRLAHSQNAKRKAVRYGKPPMPMMETNLSQAQLGAYLMRIIERERGTLETGAHAARVELAEKWLRWRLTHCMSGVELVADRTNEVVTRVFGLNCWTFFRKLCKEGKVNFTLLRTPKMYMATWPAITQAPKRQVRRRKRSKAGKYPSSFGYSSTEKRRWPLLPGSFEGGKRR